MGYAVVHVLYNKWKPNFQLSQTHNNDPFIGHLFPVLKITDIIFLKQHLSIMRHISSLDSTFEFELLWRWLFSLDKKINSYCFTAFRWKWITVHSRLFSENLSNVSFLFVVLVNRRYECCMSSHFTFYFTISTRQRTRSERVRKLLAVMCFEPSKNKVQKWLLIYSQAYL